MLYWCEDPFLKCHTGVRVLFLLQAEERVQCTMSGKVSYARKPELILTLPIPMEMATNKGERSNSFSLCLLMSLSLSLSLTAEVDAWEERKQKLQDEKKKMSGLWFLVAVHD